MKYKKLYHCCPERWLKRIFKEGLNPPNSQSSLTAVFLAGDKDTAKNYAHMRRPYQKFVLLSILLKDLDDQELGPDNYELQDYLETHCSRYDHWKEADWEYSLAKVSQVAYYGLISPDLITVEEIFKRK